MANTSHTPTIVLIALCIIATMTCSCEKGKAIKRMNDNCPIELTYGIYITKVNSTNKGKNIEVHVHIEDYISEDEIDDEVVRGVKQLMVQNPYGAKLWEVAVKENAMVSFIFSGTHGSSVTRTAYWGNYAPILNHL